MAESIILAALVALLVTAAGCSLFNRFGPEVTCDDLQNGQINACAEGIIATCDDGDVAFEVCNEDLEGTDADEVCEASWQVEGAYRCAPDGTGGAGGGGMGPATLMIASTAVTEDSNGDGLLSPGETARVQVYVENTGAEPVTAASASLTAWDPSLLLVSCTARGSYGSAESCTSTCDCKNVPDSGKMDFAGGETGVYPLLEVELRVAEDAPLAPAVFDVHFEDSAARTWNATFDVPIEATRADLRVGSVELTEDSNADGALTPGETARIRIYAENDGSSQARDLSASLSGWDDDVVVTSCTARGDYGSAESCTSMCDCTNVPDSGKQIVDPAQTGVYPLLEVDILLSESAALAPIVFDVVFADDWGNTWTDTVEVEVVATGAEIEVGSVVLTDDTNDDGELSPGESGTLLIYAENVGTSRVLDLTARLAGSVPNVTVSSCTARGNFGSAESCVPVCNCINVPDSGKQTLDPGTDGTYGILEVDFSLSAAAPLGMLTFNVAFEDDWSNVWSDSFQVPVVP